MAQRTQIVLIDDLDGTEIKDGEAQSITFSWSGVDYSIDLSKANADKFEKAIGPYLEKAQRVGGRKSGRPLRRVERPGRHQGGPRLGRVERHRAVEPRPGAR